MSFSNVGKVWSPLRFERMLVTTPRPNWVKGITLHHTAAPSLATRPNGLTAVHLENIAAFYRVQLGWSAGPHLFVDEDQIWGMTPLDVPGVHARSFNRTHIGIEVLGEYDSEDPTRGRGQACWAAAAFAVSALMSAWDLHQESINFHRDDPKTSKTCPGQKVKRSWFLALVDSTNNVHPDELQETICDTKGQFVPVMQWLKDNGFPNLKLKRAEGATLLDGWRMETAYYDKFAKQTLATRAELERWQTTR